MSIDNPEWVRSAVFYQIFPDRFASSERVAKPANLEAWDSPPTHHGFKGGDLLGVVEHLDYLQDLGITALYFNPIFQSTANHRYHTHDYLRVDPMLGGDGALRTLLDAAHNRGIRVILDGVFNHASRGFFQFNDIVENGPASPYLDWFIVHRFPLRPYNAPSDQHGYEAWWNLAALPKLNVRTPAVREFLWRVAVHWLEFGADGWRLDVPAEINDDEFWREFRRRTKAVNPEAYLVGEIWHEADRWLRGDQFDAVMNYLFTRASLGFFVGENLLRGELARTGLHPVPALDAPTFRDEINRVLALYPKTVNAAQLNLLGSHDMPRFKTLARGDASAYRLATLFQMSYPGAPCIYYGDEIGLEGGHDPGGRGAFPWDPARWDADLRDYVRDCISLRHAHPALRQGDLTWLLAEGSLVAYARSLGTESLIVILNAGHRPVTLSLPVAGLVPDSAVLKEVWGQEAWRVTGGRVEGVRVPARSGMVLEIAI